MCLFLQDWMVPLLLQALFLPNAIFAGPHVDWPTFLARSDPINVFNISSPNTIPDVWLEGSFAGNGMIGTQVLVCPAVYVVRALTLTLTLTLTPTLTCAPSPAEPGCRFD